MIVTRKAIPRRTLLCGLGAAVALPLLDGMAPALTALSRSAARPVRRFGVVYVPNGVVIDQWMPATTGAGFELSPILKPLEPFRDRLLVLTGLTQNVNGLTAGSGAVHGRCATKYLTGAIPRPFGQEGNDFLADVSLDQLVARQLGQDTALGSLELSLESGDKGPAPATAGIAAPTAIRSRGAVRGRRSRWSTTRAWCSSDVRRRRQHRPGGAPGAAGAEPEPARLGKREGGRTSRAASGRATPPSSPSISTRCGTSSGASSVSRRRLRASCRRSTSRPACPRASRTTRG